MVCVNYEIDSKGLDKNGGRRNNVSKPASKEASKQARKQASKQARK